MNAVDRFERELPAALRDVAGAARPDYLTDILGQTAATPQRSAWASLERWLPVELTTTRPSVGRVPWKAGAVLAALVLLGVLAVLYAGSQPQRVPPPFGPAANGEIPYSLNGDIYVGDPESGRTRLILGGAENDYAPTFAPDGTRVAFLRASANCPTPGDVCPGGEEIVVVRADGTDAHVITNGFLVGVRVATWSPDSRALVIAYDSGGSQHLALTPVDGGEPRAIADGLDVDWIVFRPPGGDEFVVRGRRDGVWGLYAMSVDGGEPRLLASSVFSDGTAREPDQDLNFPAYSPDGRKIYYNRYTSPPGTIQAWVMNADGSDQHRFNAAGPSCCWWEGEMAPSPDGKSVVMWRVPPSQPGRVTLFPADGTGDGLAIGPGVAGTGHWSWAPDSSRILLNFNDASEGDEGLVDPVTGAFTTLPWNADAEPDWQRRAVP